MKKKFKKDKNYKALCLIMSPNGIIPKGTIFTDKKWMDILVYEVGNDFKRIFEEIKK